MIPRMSIPKPDGWQGGSEDCEIVDHLHGHRSTSDPDSMPVIDLEDSQHSRTIDEFGDA